MLPLQQTDLPGVQEPSAARHRPQQVLGPDDRVVLPKPGDLALDVATVGRVRRRHLGPIDLEVPADAVPSLRFPVLGDLTRQQRVVRPRCAVEDARSVGRRTHRPEVALPLLRLDVLGLVALQ
jgi:hypothetical protein